MSSAEDFWNEVLGKNKGGAMSVTEGEQLGTPKLSDAPQDGDQRLNNEGKLESYYGGMWIVKET